MNKFEQLIEYVINDEQDKAKELFHEIVVEKSRNIYEELMAEEELEETKEEELEEAKHEGEEELDEGMGGDQADDLIDDVEADEQGMNFEGEEDVAGDEEIVDGDHADEENAADLEDRVVDIEDKLDELMAEFEALMGDEDHADEEGAEELGAEEELDAEEGEEELADLEEGLDLKAAPKPVTSEEGSVNTKGVVAANSGANGAVAKPVASATGEEKGRPAPTAKDLGVSATQDAGKGAFKSAAPKAQTKEPAGINTKSIN
jgi:hypothetical protein